jgi:hypothetical protein
LVTDRTFRNTEPAPAWQNEGEHFHLADDFLLNGVFGARLGIGDWDAAAMVGWTNYWTHPKGTGFGYPVGHPSNPDTGATDFSSNEFFQMVSIPVYLGATYAISPELTAGADMTARFLYTGPYEGATGNTGQYPFDSTPVFNLGAFIAFGAPENNGFWARAEVFALELGLDLEYANNRQALDPKGNMSYRVFRPVTEGTKTLGFELWAGFNASWDDGWENNGPDFWAGLWVRFGNFFAFDKFDGGVDLKAGAGWNEFRLMDQLFLNANVFVHSTVRGGDEPTFIGFKVVPELEWRLIPNGSITLGYLIGYNWNMDRNELREGTPLTGGSVLVGDEWMGTDRVGVLTQHQLDITFKWSFN